MSIYASTLSFDDEFPEEGNTAPILYRGSHVYPDPEDRGGEMDFGVIPGHIAEGGGYDEEHEHWATACHRPFLRVGFRDPFGNEYPDKHATPSSGTVVLDAKQVEELRDYLNDFLARVTNSGICGTETKAEAEAALETFLRERVPG